MVSEKGERAKTDFVCVYCSSTCSLKATVCFPLIVSGMELASLSVRLSLMWSRSASPRRRRAGSGSLNKRLKKVTGKVSYNLKVYFVNKGFFNHNFQAILSHFKVFPHEPQVTFLVHRRGMCLSKAAIITSLHSG